MLSLQNKHKTDRVDIYYSPDKEYKLTIEYFIPKENQGWDYTRGILTQCSTGNELELIRNIGTFPFEWVVKDKESYLLCGQDYQGYTIVNLKDMKASDFVPEEFYEGRGFCWVEIKYTDGIDVLVVGGCYWADEYEIIFYDFSNPLQLPYKELKRIKPYEKIIGWKDKSNFQYVDEEGNIQTVKII
ncbi:hypothetical protein D3C77_494980 [compost metagenome]